MKDDFACSICVVFVHYGNYQSELRCRTDVFNISRSIRFVSVDTSDLNLSANDAFEFSGYQLGLQDVLEHLKGNSVRVVFLNDTIYSSHSYLFFKIIFHRLLNVDLSRESLVGVGSQWQPGPLGVSINYFPTFMFALFGSRQSLSSFRFYNISFSNDGWPVQWQNLSNSYKEAVNAWLQPSSLLGGWYKSHPNVLLPENVLRRKQYTIYQEHTLLMRAKSSGFAVLDLGGVGWSRSIVRVLKFLDRSNCVFKKLVFRINYYMGCARR